MPESLDVYLTRVRSRVRRVVLAHGLSWSALAMVGLLASVCAADWAFHFDDPGVRLILGLAAFGFSVVVVYRRFVVPWRFPLRDVDLALRIEDRYPAFHGSLASAVQFLEGRRDPRVGSPALQAAVINGVMHRVAGLNLDDVVDLRKTRRVTVLAVGVCLVVAALVALSPSNAGLALRRLVLPFSTAPWPRSTNLRVLDADFQVLTNDPANPLRVVRGDTLKFYVENAGGRPPPKVLLEWNVAGSAKNVETLRPAAVRDIAGKPRELAAGQILALQGPIVFRVTGGDDDTLPAYELQVIPPPLVEQLEVRLTPPAYARRPVVKLPAGMGHIEGLVGTQVGLTARVNKPLRSAVLRIKDQERQVAQISADGREISATFTIKESGAYSYWLDLQDSEGFENSDAPRYEIRGIPDIVPDVSIEAPPSDLLVTSDAVIRLKTAAKDDLGLKTIGLRYQWGEGESERTAVVALFAGGARPLQQTVEYDWALAVLKLEPGARVVFHAEAEDDYDLGPPHVGRSISRTLTVVTPAEKSQELAQRQSGLMEELERALKLQNQAHDQVEELRLQWKKAGGFRAAELDMLQRLELGQRQVGAQLAGPADGVEKRARELLGELRDNQIDDVETERRFEQIASELQRLGGDNLPAIEADLTQARKLAQSGATNAPRGKTTSPQAADGEQPLPGDRRPAAARAGGGKRELPSPAPTGDRERDPPRKPQPARIGESTTPKGGASDQGEALDRAADNQRAVIESLTDMVQRLARWRSERDASQELAELVEGQTGINKDTAELGRQTLTRSKEALTPQQQADLARLAERQKQQADKFDQLQKKMAAMVQQLQSINPDAAAALQDAVEQAPAIAEPMRDASRQIDANRMGEAAQLQERVVGKMRDLEDGLRNRRDSDGETLVKQLRQAEQQLDEMHKQQADLLHKLQDLAQVADPAEREAGLQKLKQEQQQLRDEAARLARQLRRLQMHRPGAAAQRAAARMAKAQDDLEQGEPAEAAEEQQEALDDLEQAQREAAQERRDVEEQLAREQLEKIADELQGMIAREQTVIDETRRLEAIRASRGNWTRPQRRSLLDLVSVQKELRSDTERIAETLTSAKVFALALKGAARSMQRAQDLLAEQNTSAPTQAAEEAALKRFVDLVQSLKAGKGKSGESAAQPDAPGGGGAEQGPPTDGIEHLAQFKMLLVLQRELAERTSALLEREGQTGGLTPAERDELAALSAEQGELADLTRNLTELFLRNASDEPQPADEPDKPAAPPAPKPPDKAEP